MRDPEYIKEFLIRIAQLWIMYPELTFNQFIAQGLPGEMIFFLDDHDTIKQLEEHYLEFGNVGDTVH